MIYKIIRSVLLMWMYYMSQVAEVSSQQTQTIRSDRTSHVQGDNSHSMTFSGGMPPSYLGTMVNQLPYTVGDGNGGTVRRVQKIQWFTGTPSGTNSKPFPDFSIFQHNNSPTLSANDGISNGTTKWTRVTATSNPDLFKQFQSKDKNNVFSMSDRTPMSSLPTAVHLGAPTQNHPLIIPGTVANINEMQTKWLKQIKDQMRNNDITRSDNNPPGSFSEALTSTNIPHDTNTRDNKPLKSLQKHITKSVNFDKPSPSEIDRIVESVKMPAVSRKHLKKSSHQIQDDLKLAIKDWFKNVYKKPAVSATLDKQTSLDTQQSQNILVSKDHEQHSTKPIKSQRDNLKTKPKAINQIQTSRPFNNNVNTKNQLNTDKVSGSNWISSVKQHRNDPNLTTAKLYKPISNTNIPIEPKETSKYTNNVIQHGQLTHLPKHNDRPTPKADEVDTFVKNVKIPSFSRNHLKKSSIEIQNDLVLNIKNWFKKEQNKDQQTGVSDSNNALNHNIEPTKEESVVNVNNQNTHLAKPHSTKPKKVNSNTQPKNKHIPSGKPSITSTSAKRFITPLNTQSIPNNAKRNKVYVNPSTNTIGSKIAKTNKRLSPKQAETFLPSPKINNLAKANTNSKLQQQHTKNGNTWKENDQNHLQKHLKVSTNEINAKVSETVKNWKQNAEKAQSAIAAGNVAKTKTPDLTHENNRLSQPSKKIKAIRQKSTAKLPTIPTIPTKNDRDKTFIKPVINAKSTNTQKGSPLPKIILNNQKHTNFKTAQRKHSSLKTNLKQPRVPTIYSKTRVQKNQNYLQKHLKTSVDEINVKVSETVKNWKQKGNNAQHSTDILVNNVKERDRATNTVVAKTNIPELSHNKRTPLTNKIKMIKPISLSVSKPTIPIRKQTKKSTHDRDQTFIKPAMHEKSTNIQKGSPLPKIILNNQKHTNFKTSSQRKQSSLKSNLKQPRIPTTQGKTRAQKDQNHLQKHLKTSVDQINAKVSETVENWKQKGNNVRYSVDSTAKTPTIPVKTQTKQSTPTIPVKTQTKQSTPTIPVKTQTKQSTPTIPVKTQTKQSTPTIPVKTQTKQSTPTIPVKTQTKQSTPTIPVKTQTKQSTPTIPVKTQTKQSTPTIPVKTQTKQSTHTRDKTFIKPAIRVKSTNIQKGPTLPKITLNNQKHTNLKTLSPSKPFSLKTDLKPPQTHAVRGSTRKQTDQNHLQKHLKTNVNEINAKVTETVKRWKQKEEKTKPSTGRTASKPTKGENLVKPNLQERSRKTTEISTDLNSKRPGSFEVARSKPQQQIKAQIKPVSKPSKSNNKQAFHPKRQKIPVSKTNIRSKNDNAPPPKFFIPSLSNKSARKPSRWTSSVHSRRLPAKHSIKTYNVYNNKQSIKSSPKSKLHTPKTNDKQTIKSSLNEDQFRPKSVKSKLSNPPSLVSKQIRLRSGQTTKAKSFLPSSSHLNRASKLSSISNKQMSKKPKSAPARSTKPSIRVSVPAKSKSSRSNQRPPPFFIPTLNSYRRRHSAKVGLRGKPSLNALTKFTVPKKQSLTLKTLLRKQKQLPSPRITQERPQKQSETLKTLLRKQKQPVTPRITLGRPSTDRLRKIPLRNSNNDRLGTNRKQKKGFRNGVSILNALYNNQKGTVKPLFAIPNNKKKRTRISVNQPFVAKGFIRKENNARKSATNVLAKNKLLRDHIENSNKVKKNVFNLWKAPKQAFNIKGNGDTKVSTTDVISELFLKSTSRKLTVPDTNKVTEYSDYKKASNQKPSRTQVKLSTSSAKNINPLGSINSNSVKPKAVSVNRLDTPTAQLSMNGNVKRMPVVIPSLRNRPKVNRNRNMNTHRTNGPVTTRDIVLNTKLPNTKTVYNLAPHTPIVKAHKKAATIPMLAKPNIRAGKTDRLGRRGQHVNKQPLSQNVKRRQFQLIPPIGKTQKTAKHSHSLYGSETMKQLMSRATSSGKLVKFFR